MREVLRTSELANLPSSISVIDRVVGISVPRLRRVGDQRRSAVLEYLLRADVSISIISSLYC